GDHRARFLSKPITERLNVKGTAWLARFPINNLEIILGRDSFSGHGSADEIAENFSLRAQLHDKSDPAVLRAYIGASVDLGFRLRAFSTPRKTGVSADLVWMLCH